MKATANQEVYRPFAGTIAARPLRFWPLVTSGIKSATKKKIPLLLLYAVPTIATVVLSFLVYARFAALANELPQTLGGGIGLVDVFARRAMARLEVRNMIIEFVIVMQVFALLSVSWFGSGLLVDDRRAGAHQLYFARPLTRSDYLLGKFLVAAFFSLLVIFLPGLVMCLVASLASERWQFVREQGAIFWQLAAFSALWTLVMVSVVLCASSLAPRKSLALAAVFALFMFSDAIGQILAHFQGTYFRVVGLFTDLRIAADWIFTGDATDETGAALAVLGGLVLLNFSVIAWRVRRLEVVA